MDLFRRSLDTPLIAAASQSMIDSVIFLIQSGADIHKANHIPERSIEVAANMEIVRILVDHGADINDINSEMHARLLGVQHDSEPQASSNDYIAGKNCRFGLRNPEQIDNPFWMAMVRSGASAWHARQKFADSDISKRLPVWNLPRFS